MLFVIVLTLASGCAVNGRNEATHKYHQLVANASIHSGYVPLKTGKRAASQIVLASAQEEVENQANRLNNELDGLPVPEDGEDTTSQRENETNSTRTAPDDALKNNAVADDEGDFTAEDEGNRDPRSDDDGRDEAASDGSTADEDEEEGESKDDESNNDLEDQQNNAPLFDRTCVDINPLNLSEVLDSVANSYPLLEVALAELATADGKTLATWGQL